MKQARIRNWLNSGAKRLESDIYQREKLNIPVMTGIFNQKKYIPQEMKAAEAKYIIKHMDIHAGRHDGVLRAAAFVIMSIQWFNPFMWRIILYAGILRRRQTRTRLVISAWKSVQSTLRK